MSDAEITELVSHLDELSLRPGELVYDVGGAGDACTSRRGRCNHRRRRQARRRRLRRQVLRRAIANGQREARDAEVANGRLCATSAPAAKEYFVSTRPRNLLGRGLAVTTQSSCGVCSTSRCSSRSPTSNERRWCRTCSPGYAEGEVVFRQGDPGDKFYIVETGNVAIHRESRHLRHQRDAYQARGVETRHARRVLRRAGAALHQLASRGGHVERAALSSCRSRRRTSTRTWDRSPKAQPAGQGRVRRRRVRRQGGEQPGSIVGSRAMTDKSKPCLASARSARFCYAGIRATPASSR